MEDRNRINNLNILNPKFENICARIRQHQQNQKQIQNLQSEKNISHGAESPSASTASFNRSPPLSSISGHSSRAESHSSTPEPTTLSLSSGIGTSLNNTDASFTDSTKYSTKTELKFSIEAILRSDFANNNNPSSSNAAPSTHSSASSSCSAFSSPHSTSSLLCVEDCNNTNNYGRPGAHRSSLNSPSENNTKFPAWIFCTRYSDRPSSGPRNKKLKRRKESDREISTIIPNNITRTSTSPDEEKRPRTAFTNEQLERLKQQFSDSRYLTEKRRQELAHELGLNESQIKIWFQNKRAKIKKSVIVQRPATLAFQLMAAQGLLNQ